MSDWLFPPSSIPSLAIEGSAARFPVRRILCVGRNYAAHAREMGADPTREAPFFFSKPGDAVVGAGDDVAYPRATADLHHEVELVCALGPATDGGVAIVAWGVGVDLTRRDLQADAKAKGRPWDAAKGFDQSAPCGLLALQPPAPDAAIRLSVNGQTRQSATLDDMIWSAQEVLVEAGKLWALAPGDLIFTGTPEGVGAVSRGDRIRAEIDGLAPLEFTLT